MPIKIKSPCIDNCCLNEKDICLGCFRSVEEIIQWNQSTDKQKKMVLQYCKERQKLWLCHR